MLAPKASSLASTPLPHSGASAPVQEQTLLRADAEKMSVYFKGMHAMLNAGVLLTSALDEMSRSAPNGDLRLASAQMKTNVNNGRRWSESMRAYPGLFSEMMVALVAAGERSGTLVQSCATLGGFAEQEYNLRQTIKRETWYSRLLIFFSTVVFPLPITIVLGDTRFTLYFAQQMVIVFVPYLLWRAACWAWPVTSRGKQRFLMDDWKLRMPILGKVVRGFAVAKSCRMIALLYTSGIKLSHALRIAGDACGNAAFGEKLRQVAPRLERGDTLTSALIATDQFPDSALGLLRSGEQAGELDTTLNSSARFLEIEAETRLHQTMQTLFAILLIVVGAKIGVQVIQFWMTFYGMFTR